MPDQEPPKRRLPAPPPAAPALSALSGVKVRVTAIVGGTEMTFDEAVALDVDALIALDRTREEPVDLCVNGRIVARGKLVVVGGTYGVQITELVESAEKG